MWYEQKVRFRKPWCLAGLYLSGCTCWSILQIPKAGAKLQPASALQKHRSSVWLQWLSGPNTRSAPAICCWWGSGAGMSFSAWHWEVKVEHCAKCLTQLTLPRLPWADLFRVWVSLWLLLIRSCFGGVALSPGQDWDPLCLALHKRQSWFTRCSSPTSQCRITAPSLAQVENGQTLNTFALPWPSLNHKAISSGLQSIIWGQKRLIKSLFTNTKGDGALSQLLSPCNLYHDD